MLIMPRGLLARFAVLLGISLVWCCLASATLLAQDAPAPAPPMKPAAQPLDHPFPKRAPAPEISGGSGWLNATGPLELKDLRGKFVLLDFWTYCCINCMHILPELKKLEHAYPNNLVVIGVHSAKFDEEKDLENIRAAILRHEIEHPVVNDPDHKIWDKYFVNSWPSLRVIDPEGNLVAIHSGEVDFEDLDGFLKNALPYYREKKLLNEQPLQFNVEAAKAAKTPLRFPGKVLADESGNRLFISDSNHNRIVVSDLAGKLLYTIGSGAAGKADGTFATAQFDHPQGIALSGQLLYVADTENHLLRKVDLAKQTVTTIAGLGSQARQSWPGIVDNGPLEPPTIPERFADKPLKVGINSPWDVLVHQQNLYIAMAGSHQIWKMPLDESELGIYAGNGREHITDGALLPKRPYDNGPPENRFSAFAQPSGLASDGQSLFVADCEGSAVRAVPFTADEKVTTLVGTPNVRSALFNFGDKDGKLEEAQFQHCIGVAYHSGTVYVADTYNNKIKAIDIAKKTATTFAGTGKEGKADGAAAAFDEPTGLAIAQGKLYVADTNNHLIRVIDLKSKQTSTLTITGLQPPVKVQQPVAVAEPGKKPTFRKPKEVKLDELTVKPSNGQVDLQVQLTLPTGWKMNELAATVYYVEVTTPNGPVDRQAINIAGKNKDAVEKFNIPLKLTAETGSDTVVVSLNYYYCMGGPDGVCKNGSVVWTRPIKLDAAAKESVVPLPLTVEE
jgi:DNA-binding beta-propeller fold protein YncE/cytochrome oxidase Cu insertion factor (SCO1/SenC/PrrC family)